MLEGACKEPDFVQELVMALIHRLATRRSAALGAQERQQRATTTSAPEDGTTWNTRGGGTVDGDTMSYHGSSSTSTGTWSESAGTVAKTDDGFVAHGATGGTRVYPTNEAPLAGIYAERADVLFAWIPGVTRPSPAPPQ